MLAGSAGVLRSSGRGPVEPLAFIAAFYASRSLPMNVMVLYGSQFDITREGECLAGNEKRYYCLVRKNVIYDLTIWKLNIEFPSSVCKKM